MSSDDGFFYFIIIAIILVNICTNQEKLIEKTENVEKQKIEVIDE